MKSKPSLGVKDKKKKEEIFNQVEVATKKVLVFNR